MQDAQTASNLSLPKLYCEKKMWDLFFSTAGAAIAIALAIIVVAIAVVILSLRNQTIDIGAKGYTFKLGPKTAELPPTSSLPTQVSAKPDSPTVEDEKVPNENEPTKSSNEFSVWLKRLQKAKKEQDRHAIEECFDTKYKDEFFPQTPYDWEVWKHIELLRAGFVDSIREVERLERENPALTEASRALARYYLRIGAPEKASSHIENAVARANSDSDRVPGLLLKAELIENTKGKVEARNFLMEKIDLISDSEQKAILFCKLGDIYRQEGDRSLDAIAAYEQAARFDPHHKHARFHSAYLCAELDGLKLVGLRQYRMLRNQDEKYGSTLNNLGVLYGELGLSINKIKLFKAAAEIKEDYGYGNLIIANLEAGFIDEAESLANSVPDSIKRDERVVYAQGLLNQHKKEEGEKLQNVAENAEIIYQQLHEFLVRLDVSGDIFGNWTSNTTADVITIEKAGEFIKLELNGSDYRRWGLVKELRSLSVFSAQHESKSKSQYPQTLLSLAMTGPYAIGHFIVCREGLKLRLLHIQDNKLVSRADYVKHA